MRLNLRSIIVFLTHPVFLILYANVLIYGVFIPLLGFYWDDLDIIWFSRVYGPAGLAKYFSTNRPIWGLFYQIDSLLIGDKPWQWHLFMLFWRWICASGLYFLVRQLWQDKKEPGLIAALVFLVFPGFKQQPIAICYSHFFIVLSALFFSLGLSIYALHNKKNRIVMLVAAALLAGINVFSMEYFFMLELLRPILFWVTLWNKSPNQKYKLRTVILFWLPTLVVFLAAGIWRAFFFTTQTKIYSFSAISLLQSDPWLGIQKIVSTIFKDIWWIVAGIWGQVFQFPTIMEFGKRSTLLYIGIMVGILGYLLLIFLFKKPIVSHTNDRTNKMSITFIVTGTIALLLGGIPIWVTELNLSGGFPSDRFSLPFMLGSSLIFTGIFFLLSRYSTLRRTLFILLITMASGFQARIAIDYQRDWEVLQRFLGQLVWRIPSIEENTILFSNELPLKYYSDMSITAPINWTYDREIEEDVIPFVFYYPTVRYGDTIPIDANKDFLVEHDLLIGTFNGKLSQSITIYYNPPACLRIIDPEVESDNWMVPLNIRQVSQLSEITLINSNTEAQPPAALFSAGTAHKWCYYFEKADLARYQKDWPTVVELGELAFSLNDNPNDPAERLPFIEGYAHVGDWQSALTLSQQSLDTTPVMEPVLCKLWNRIESETSDTSEKHEAFETLKQQLNCSSVE